jgi:hypothetical protein
VPDALPGLDTFGVDILMESRGLGIAPGNPVGNLVPLRDDDFGTRQFLYPFLLEAAAIPEPSTLSLLVLGTAALTVGRRRRRAA